MRRLHEQFPDTLVILGVHSGKFTAEKLTANIAEAARRHGLEHPVVNDADFQIWQSYAVRGWPTVTLIDPAGYVVAQRSGEITAEDLAPAIEKLVAEFGARGELDRTPRDWRAGAPPAAERVLRYPAKLAAAPDGRLFVADTGHHRVLELRLDAAARAAAVERVYGSGRPGLRDGAAAEAEFNGPHGLALAGGVLYVADTDNHAVRAIDLGAATVTTIAGTGELAHGYFHLGAPTETALRTPWAVLALEPGLLLIAMAGSHQIWAMLGREQLGPFAGNGREALVNGSQTEASFNQPSDLAFGLGHLFVADAEAGAIRAISLDEHPQVMTLVGQGLFEFGDVDGSGPEVRLQHPTGLAFGTGHILYIADTYNHKIKTLDPTTGEVRALIGTGRPGNADGPFAEARLYEPEGIAIHGRRLFIADTNNHLVRVADLDAGAVHTLMLQGLERLGRPAGRPDAGRPDAGHPGEARPGSGRSGGAPEVQRLEPVAVAPGTVTVALDLRLPEGYKLNPDAPLLFGLAGQGEPARLAPGAVPELAVDVAESGERAFDLTVYYCETGDERLCLVHGARVALPLVVEEGAPARVRVTYRVPGP